jgi:hypothetical protein
MTHNTGAQTKCFLRAVAMTDTLKQSASVHEVANTSARNMHNANACGVPHSMVRQVGRLAIDPFSQPLNMHQAIDQHPQSVDVANPQNRRMYLAN